MSLGAPNDRQRPRFLAGRKVGPPLPTAHRPFRGGVAEQGLRGSGSLGALQDSVFPCRSDERSLAMGAGEGDLWVTGGDDPDGYGRRVRPMNNRVPVLGWRGEEEFVVVA